MGTYPKKVQLAWDVVEQFIKEWHQNPYYYENEYSIQAELYTRLRSALELSGEQFLKADYIDKWVQPGYEKKQNWSRVSAEPCFTFIYDGKNETTCHPDLAIWADNNPNEELKLNDEGNWPAIWACEIKMNFNDRGKTPSKANWDVDKMKLLMNSNNNIVQYGCWLNFNYVIKPDDKVDDWEDVIPGKLWKRNCYFPKLK